jgi:multidrug transporter EmrE-like cation transporter
MMHIELLSNRTALAALAAAGYALATLLMKIAAETGTFWPLGGIACLLSATVVAEILLMRQVDLGVAYIVVIGAETMLVLSFTYLVGEPLSSRELAGGALVLGGMVMVSV